MKRAKIYYRKKMSSSFHSFYNYQHATYVGAVYNTKYALSSYTKASQFLKKAVA